MENKVDKKSKNKKRIIDNIKNNLLEDLIKQSGIEKENFDEITFYETLNYLYNLCAINLTAINRKIRFVNQQKDKKNIKEVKKEQEVIGEKKVLEKEKSNPKKNCMICGRSDNPMSDYPCNECIKDDSRPYFIEKDNKIPKNSIFKDMFGMKKKV